MAKPLSRARVLALAWPVVLAQVATATTGIVDTAVMGSAGRAVDLGAVALAAVIFNVVYWSFGFLRMSTTGLAAQALGAGDRAESRAVLARASILGAGIGLAILVLAPAILAVALLLFGAAADVEAGAASYFGARIWGAPAILVTFGISGWLLGTGRTRSLLVLQVVLNGVNAMLDAWFVAGLGLGPAGIGAGTAIAEWVALGLGVLLVLGEFRLADRARTADRARIRALLAANRDIMIRTLALLFAFAWFTNSAAKVGTAELAGNEVLLQFITVSAFVLDALAFVTEKEAGEAFGSRDPTRLRRAVRLTSEMAVVVGAAFSALYYLGGGAVITAIVADPAARDAALAYLPFCAVVPLLGVAAWQLDGIFLGTTQGRAVRIAGLVTAVLYVVSDLVLAPRYGNTGVWIAFLLMYLYRAAGLAMFWPGLVRAAGRAEAGAG